MLIHYSTLLHDITYQVVLTSVQLPTPLSHRGIVSHPYYHENQFFYEIWAFCKKPIRYNCGICYGFSVISIISEPTNFKPNCNPSCIDLVVTAQPNLILDSGTRASLDSYCHHQIIHCKVNIRIPPHFHRANSAAIKRILTLILTRKWKHLLIFSLTLCRFSYQMKLKDLFLVTHLG